MKRAILLVATTFVLLLLSPMAASTASAAPLKGPATAECSATSEAFQAPPRVVATKMEPICTYVVTPCWLSIDFGNGDVGILWEGDLVWGDEDSVEGDYQFVYSYRHNKWGWVDWAFIARVACD